MLPWRRRRILRPRLFGWAQLLIAAALGVQLVGILVVDAAYVCCHHAGCRRSPLLLDFEHTGPASAAYPAGRLRVELTVGSSAPWSRSSARDGSRVGGARASGQDRARRRRARSITEEAERCDGRAGALRWCADGCGWVYLGAAPGWERRTPCRRRGSGLPRPVPRWSSGSSSRTGDGTPPEGAVG